MNIYHIPQLTQKISIDAHWNKMAWLKIPALQIEKYSGGRPTHFPDVQAKLTYDAEALYVIFQVEDCYVRAVAEKYQDPVFEDSCVEFFFTPGGDIHQGYFNLEINCGGTALFCHQKGRGVETQEIPQTKFEQIQIAHTLPKIVDPEIKENLSWVVEYRLPFALLTEYSKVDIPKPGARWRANFYKCADSSSHPHWISWSTIHTPIPDFHRPEYFGTLIYKD